MKRPHSAVVDSARIELTTVAVDPRKIVNDSFSRPVTAKDIAIVKKGFYQHGYISSYLIACRYAKAPETEAFFMREPHCYSQEKAEEATKSAMKQGQSGGYFFCLDGLIRKYVSFELIDEQFLSSEFKLVSSLHPSMPTEDEIAFALSRNSLNEFSVPLSFLVTLLRSHDYDSAVNAERRAKKQKVLQASEVGKPMVLGAAYGMADSKAIDKVAQSRRQILGVSRRVPGSSVSYFRELVALEGGG